jgi:hypothetical protein
VNGAAKQVSAGANEVWSLSTSGNIYKRPVDGSGAWTNVPGVLKHVSVGTNGQVWGVSDDQKVWTFINNKYYKVKGVYLNQIDVGTDSIWGVQANGDVYTKTNKNYDPNWVQIPGKLKYVSSDNENVVGLGMANEFKVCKKPCKGSWVTREGNFSQVDITDSNLAAVSADKKVYVNVKKPTAPATPATTGSTSTATSPATSTLTPSTSTSTPSTSTSTSTASEPAPVFATTSAMASPVPG